MAVYEAGDVGPRVIGCGRRSHFVVVNDEVREAQGCGRRSHFVVNDEIREAQVKYLSYFVCCGE